MNRPLILILMLIQLVSLGPSVSATQMITGSISFDPNELVWENLDGYDVPRLYDCDVIREPGAPQLPVCVLQVAIPPNTAVERVEVVSSTSHLLPDQHLIYPAQPPQILSLTHERLKDISLVKPQMAIYESEKPFPARILDFTGTGHMGDVHLVNLLVYPLQYLPQERKIRFHRRIDFAVHLSPARTTRPLRRSRPPGLRDPLHQAAEHLTHDGLNYSHLPTQSLDSQGRVQVEDLAEYVIVTDMAFQDAFQVLADWKTKRGVPAQVVTTIWIDAEYQGADRRERIRQFITDAYQNWGTVWVLLAGDTQLIPHRLAYAMDSHTDYNDIPCDLYYADLDGDWNADGDDTYGELEDIVDLYPEVFVGRAPVSTVAQAENFVHKVMTYEKPTLLDYQQEVLFAAEILWWSPYTDASESKELIDERYLPARFDPITKLYESLGNENPYAVLQVIDEGVGIINHDGHAYYSVMGMGTGYIDNSDMDYLNNGDRIGLLYSIGCWPAAFDYDCIAEHFVNNPNGGGVAFIGNSRYGWGSPGNPCFGYSDRFDQQFFKVVFQDGITRVGQALATTKAFYAPRSRQENVYRWHQYQLTLLGDPEMPLWTETPRSLAVEHPQQIPSDTSLVTVSATEDDQAVVGALVCLMGDDGMYQRATTDLFGKASFAVSPGTSESLSVTVTATNFLPYEGQIMVLSGKPHLAIQGVDVQEISGNEDGVISPGERIGLSVSLKNWGDEMAGGVTATVDCADEYVVMEDSAFSFGDMEPGQVVSSEAPCCFTVGDSCPNGQPLRFALEVRDQSGHSWNREIGLLVSTPMLLPQSYVLDDGVLGDGDGVPEAGEELGLTITVINSGGERARELVMDLETEDPYLMVLQSRAEVGDVEADSTAEATFQLQVSPGCPEPRFPVLELKGATSDGYEYQRELLLSIGQVGFSDDLEGESHFWSRWATDDHWHFTTRRAHSGTMSWYCGEEATAFYSPGMDCPLTTMPVVVGPGTKLSFWHWYDLATYGSDGLYVEIRTGTDWEILDFLGSGGALDSTLMRNDWLEDTYDLSYIEPGSFLQVRFRFYSDDDTVVGEGAYVDDVSITGDILSNRTQDQGGSSPSHPLSFRLSQNYPNPFNALTHLFLTIPAQGRDYRGPLPVPATAEVYNISGQKVKTLLREKLFAGEYRLIWDGTDQQGRHVSSGIYFFRVEAGPFRHTKKMILLR